jgi:hypothetical protein
VKFPYEMKIFSVIIVSTLLIFSFSHFGVQAFEGIISKVKGFPENTWIGPIDVSGLEKTEASQQITTKVTEWQTNSTIQLSFKEVNGSFPIENINFNIEKSVQAAKNSTKNEVLITIEDSALQESLTALSSTFSENKVDVDTLKRELITKVSSLQTGTININVEDFLSIPVLKEQIVHTVSIPIINDDLKNIGASLIIESKTAFSLLSFLEKQGLKELDSSIIDLVSSGIYQAILPTNFEILERHIGAELPENISLGFEAKVDSNLKWDLSFYNPNEDNYKIEIYSEGQFLKFDVVGVPFLYEYTIMQEGMQMFNPKTIKQYSPLLEPGLSKITKSGQKGFYLEISRLIIDETGKVLEQQLVSKDYYAPIHQVEVVGLGTKEAVLADEEPSTDVILGEAINGSVDQEDFSVNNVIPQETDSSNIDNEQDPIWGKPDEIGK